MTPVRRSVLAALPAFSLALAGLLHPHHLDYDTSAMWFGLHVPGLLVFPLVGAGLAWLVAGRGDALAWAVRGAAYVYATCYTALDVVSGMAAGWVTHELGPGVPRPPEVSLLFRLGTPVGEVGSWALVLVAALLLVDGLLRRRGALVALGGALLVGGAALVHVGHIFAPTGVAGMALLGCGILLRAPRS